MTYLDHKLSQHYKFIKKEIKRKHWVEIRLEFTLHYITLTNYYIVKDTFRSQVVTAL